MIRFKQFIAEARSAPLYHRTSMYWFDSIMDKGLEPKTGHVPKHLLKTSGNFKYDYGGGFKGENVKGVSTTRSFNFAKTWGDIQERVIFELDQQKLSQRYEIRPIQYFSSDSGKARFQGNNIKNEAEEFIISLKSIPLKYVTAIYFSLKEETKQKYAESIRAAKNKYPFIEFKNIDGSTYK